MGQLEQRHGEERCGRVKVDYREVLSPEDFAVFARLRQVRKEIAQDDAVPVYTVFTNEQLAQMVQGRATTKAALEKIAGVGDQPDTGDRGGGGTTTRATPLGEPQQERSGEPEQQPGLSPGPSSADVVDSMPTQPTASRPDGLEHRAKCIPGRPGAGSHRERSGRVPSASAG